MKKDPGFSDKLRYYFDNTLARGTIALIGWLAVISLVIIVIGAGILAIGGLHQTGEVPLSFGEAAWESLMRTLDAGTMGGDEGWGFRWVMFFVTIGGVFIISTLIGILTSGLESKIEDLRKGRSLVIEKNHTIILGWTDQIFTIISELVEANANQKDACIVLLGDKDKIAMQDEVRGRIPNTKTTRIVARTGSPIDMEDLEIVSINTSKSIIILSPETDDPDSEVIKALLAIVNNPGRRNQPFHIVAEIRDPQNLGVSQMVGKDEVELVLVSSLIARIIAQTCRQSGLSVVYTELLDFGGDEIYFKNMDDLSGKTFAECALMFEDSTLIGLCPVVGNLQLNPPMETVISPGDQLIFISEDDDTVLLSKKQDIEIDETSIIHGNTETGRPERTLILGWNNRGLEIIRELDNYVPDGSEVLVVAEGDSIRDLRKEDFNGLLHQNFTIQSGETTDRRLLDSLEIGTYHHVIILCYSDTLSIQQADAETLVTLLHLRDISEKTGKVFSIVSEMLDIRNRNLADVTRADDFIVSNKLISLMLAQISENKQLNAVFTDIFDPDGSEIYLKKASRYIKLNQPVNFYSIVESAARLGEVAIGYRIKALANDPSRAYGVVVNPDKSNKITLNENDRIIVLAEN
jgi:ion channel POLLUX/CASTOR